MAEPYQIRSDFADEIISADIQSKTYEHIEKKNDYIRSNYIKVLCDENELGKHKGDYVSIECRDLDDHVVRENMIDAIQENLQHMSDNMHVTLKKILVVGLGNRFITSDALGPQAANEILVTAHLYEHEDPAYLKGTRNVAVLQPGVMGQTGLESLSIVQSVAQSYQPDLVIAIDALATRNIARIALFKSTIPVFSREAALEITGCHSVRKACIFPLSPSVWQRLPASVPSCMKPSRSAERKSSIFCRRYRTAII